MSVGLLLPAGLLALAALLVPLLLHLARRSEQRITDFAALRWLASQPRPRRKRRFDERLLLLLRLLLLAALALLLAQPVLRGAADRTPWVVAVPGVPASAARAAVGAGDAQLHWLAPGFPALDAPPPPGPLPFSSLLRELDARAPAGAPLTLLVPAVLDGADAQRPRLSRTIEWRVVDGAAATARPDPPPAPPVPLEVRAAADAEGLRYLRAVAAVAGHPVHIALPGDALPTDARQVAWLVPGPLPAAVRQWVRNGGRLLLSHDADAAELAQADALWTDAHGDAVVRGTAAGRGRLMQFTRPLAPAAMPQLLEADFPRRLQALFADAPPAPGRVAARDHAPGTGLPHWPQPARPLAPWLALLAGVLFLLERWLAAGPRRGAGA